MSASFVKIAVRLRPPNPSSPLVIITTSKDQHVITIKDPKTEEEKKFDFYRIFTPQQTQEDLFETICRPLVDFVLEGNNSCFLAYGQSGSGKHYTLFGDQDYLPDNRGVVMRALEVILDETKRLAGSKETTISASFYELYGDRVRDLGLSLSPDLRMRLAFPEQNLDVMEDMEQRESKISGLLTLPIRSIPELMVLLRAGGEMRREEELKNGPYESYAHTFVSIFLTQTDRLIPAPPVRSVLHFVQLASADRLSKTSRHSDILSVHDSLTALGKVIGALGTDDVPYRDSKLTRILSSAIRDRNITALVVTINPAPIYYEESLSAFEFAERCLEIPQNEGKTELSSDYLTAAHQGFRIKVLQGELTECKNKLIKTTEQHEKQLQMLKEMLGIRVDVHALIQAQPGSKERQWLNNQKEAIQRIDILQRKNQELDKQCEENKMLFEKIRDLEEANQEKHIREVLELRDELQNLQEDLASFQQQASHKSRAQLQVRTEELKQMLAHSHKLIEEKAAVMDQMPDVMKTVPLEVGAANQRNIGKDEIDKLFSQRLEDQRHTHETQLRLAQEQSEQILNEKEAEMRKLETDLMEFRRKKKAEMKEIREEEIRLYDLIQAELMILGKIEKGEYNQHLRKVNYPKDRVPTLPTAFTHPYLFKALGTRVEPSKHPIKQLQASLRPNLVSGLSQNASLSIPANKTQPLPVSPDPDLPQRQYCMSVNLDILRFEDAKKIAKSLQDFYKENDRKVKTVSVQAQEMQVARTKLEAQLSLARSERDKYKGLYTNEVKKKFVSLRQEDRLVLESQKRLLEKDTSGGTSRCVSRGRTSRPSTSIRPQTTAARMKPGLMDVA